METKDDLSKRKKDDLIKLVKNQTKMIEHRDKELDELRRSTESRIENLKRSISEERQKIISIKDEEIKALKNNLEALRNQNGRTKSLKDFEQVENERAQYKKAYESNAKILNVYREQHGNVLKVLSGLLGQSLTINEILEAEVK